MKRFIRMALIYAIAGLCAGVFYREFTKFSGFTGSTVLGVAHTHLLALGMGGFFICALFEGRLGLTRSRMCRPFLICYNAGLVLAAVMLIVRGIWQVRGLPDSAAISGIAGLGHILLALGIFFLFAALFDRLHRTE